MPRLSRGAIVPAVVDGAREMLGAAVVRGWVEHGPPRQLKIRVTTKPDVRHEEMTIGVTTDVDAACQLVRGWLEGIVDRALA
jgi:hypothetical protein